MHTNHVSSLVSRLKESDEDFEFYPTTPEILDCVLKHAFDDDVSWDRRRRSRSRSDSRVLDVGAGHGAFLRAWQQKDAHSEMLAIERSTILMGELVKIAKVIGTDFHQQSFVNKTVDVVFCNPPYSEYSLWTSRLISECPCADMYFVIPRRWTNDRQIRAAIAASVATVTTLGSFDFIDAERSARAVVDVIHVRAKIEKDSLFETFFKQRFPHLQESMENSQAKRKEENQEQRAGLVQRDGLIGALVTLYDLELARIQSNYDKAASIDGAVLGELGLSIDAIITTLKEKLDTLKNTYWSELFDNLSTVTDRLTCKNRNAMLNTIGGFKAVDFSKENIYAVILWICEHANNYVDSQILAVFDQMLSAANIVNYKSNARVYGKGDWRYRQAPEDMSHVSLDFRIVLESSMGLSKDYCGNARMSRYGDEFIGDLLTVASLLGFSNNTDDTRTSWCPGKPQLFMTYEGKDLFEVKAFLNGNLHLRLAQDFALALNVAVGKLRGWLRSAQETVSEFGPEAEQHFHKRYTITQNQLPLLAAG
jgi:Domain of unknown function (DUF4942)